MANQCDFIPWFMSYGQWLYSAAFTQPHTPLITFNGSRQWTKNFFFQKAESNYGHLHKECNSGQIRGTCFYFFIFWFVIMVHLPHSFLKDSERCSCCTSSTWARHAYRFNTIIPSVIMNTFHCSYLWIYFPPLLFPIMISSLGSLLAY